MNSNYINQITKALQTLVILSYKAHLKNNGSFEIEDERNGYESEQFADTIQSDCGIQFLRASTSRYGSDYTLHYKFVSWLDELFNPYYLPLTCSNYCENKNGTDQKLITSINEIDNKITYDTTRLEALDDCFLLSIVEKLNSQITYLKLKY